MRPLCWPAILALVCVPLAVAATPLEMITNGDFEQELAIGWIERTGATSATITRTTTADPDPDYEVQLIVDNGVGALELVQRCPVPDLDLSVSVKLSARADGTSGAWSVAGVRLTYRDRTLSTLGTTAIVVPSVDCPWVSTSTFHLITAQPGIWETFSFALSDELLNLPDVDPAAIEWLHVEVLIEAENC